LQLTSYYECTKIITGYETQMSA